MKPVKFRSDTRACLLDLIDFIQEQIERAKNDPSEQYVAVDAARGVVPFIQSRLKEDEFLKTIFMLTFDEQVTAPQWHEWWDSFAKLHPQDFSREVDTLLNPEQGPITILRRQLSQEP